MFAASSAPPSTRWTSERRESPGQQRGAPWARVEVLPGRRRRVARRVDAGRPPTDHAPRCRLRAYVGAPQSFVRRAIVSQARQRGLLVALLGVVVVGYVAWRANRAAHEARTREIDGATITALDLEHRTAEIEFIHPKSGTPRRIRGTIPQDCPIYINDALAPGGLADLHVGDTGSVRGTVHADLSMEAEWVRVTRPAASQPAVASQPGSAPPSGTASAADRP